MKKIKLSINALYLFILSLILLPGTISAAPAVNKDCPSYPASETLKNLLGNFTGTGADKGLGSIRCFVFEITKLALGFAGILAIIMILWGAFLYVTSYGEDTKIETAKKTVLWSATGLVVLALAYTIVNIFLNEIGAYPEPVK